MIKKKNIFLLIIILAPYIYLLPLSSGIIAMGNDFDLIYYSYKKYFFEFLQEGIFPLWSPAESVGFSLVYNPFAQVFYLPSIINFFFLLIKGTFSLHDYLLFTIFGISVFNVGLYYWLNFFNNHKLINLVVVLVSTSSLLITGFVKFPNAVHTLAWFPYVLLGINYSFYNDKKIRSFCLIFFPFIFLLTAGYPYFVVYFIFFLILYFIFILIYQINFNENFIFYVKNHFISFGFRNIISFFTPLILVSPWIKGIKSTLDLTNNRNIENVDLQFNYATEHTFSFIDIIGSWIYPVASNTAGRYNFGVFVSIIIIFFLISYFLSNFKTKKNNYLIISSLFLFLIITSFASGKDSYIFNFFWENLDSIKNLRTWPRINILLIPVITLILSLSLYYLTENKKKIQTFDQKYLIIFISLIVLSSQIYLFVNEIESSYWLDWQEKRFEYAGDVLGQPSKYILSLYDGEIHILFTFIIIIFIIFFFNSNTFFIDKKKVFLISFITITYSELFLISNLQWSLNKWKTPLTHIELEITKEFQKQLKKNREIKIIHGNNFFRDRNFQINNFMDWGYKNHVNLIRKYYPLYPANNEPNDNISIKKLNNFKHFFGINENTKVFISSNIYHEDLSSFIDDTVKYKLLNNFELDIKWNEYFGNSLEINLVANQSGWLSFIDNWDPYWKAYINDNEVEIVKLFNSYKSIKFNKGSNIIKFIYEPFQFMNFNK